MNLFGNPNLQHLRAAVRNGDLAEACQIARQSGCLDSPGGQRTARTLVRMLTESAERLSAAGNLAGAWEDLTNAVLFAPRRSRDELARRQTQLIESTIENAESCLERGMPVNAARAVDLIRNRKIADRRVDAIHSVCQWVGDADVLASAGRWDDAVNLLERAQQTRPDLRFVQSRLRVIRQNREAVEKLTGQLRRDLSHSRWPGVENISKQILQIAPNHQIALDARKRCRAESSPIPSRDVLVIAGTREPLSAAALQDSTPGTGNETRRGSTWGPSPRHTRDDDESTDQARGWQSFMLWIDGVGGYLVCTLPSVTIGRAVPQTDVDIALQADVRRHHARINRAGSTYLLEPIDETRLDRQRVKEPVILRGGQLIQLGQGVELKFELPHPLGCTARLDFTSRHRTEPWSDAVLLLGDALLIGPSAGHHIRAPRLRDELILFRRGSDLVMRGPGHFEVNGQPASGDVTIADGMRLAGERFSITVERIASGGV